MGLRSGLAVVVFAILLVPGLRAATPDGDWPSEASDYRIHVVGQGHLDAVWLWPWYESLSEAHSTFRTVLDLMKENSEFTFTAASSQFYVWIEENDPEMLKEIRKRVDEGRWGLAGGWWVEADATMSGGESLLRQGLYGQHTLRRLFGRTTDIGYNPDAPGHPASLPQILKLQAMRHFVFTRPQPHEMELPAGLFHWEGIDGTRILAYRPPQVSFVIRGALDQRIRRMLAETQPTTHEQMLLIGAGDHGGGPTRENIRSVAAIQSQSGAPVLQYSLPERYFESVRKQPIADLPLVRGGLLHHAVGGYTNVSAAKKDSRTAEAALITAEKLAAVGSIAWQCQYPKAALREAWQRAIYQHVHDSINGVSLPSHYETTARDAYGYALDVARRTLYKAAQKLAWEAPAEDPESRYLFLFNPHAWEVTVHARHQFYDWRPETPIRVEDEQGRVLPHQWTENTIHYSPKVGTLITRVTLPPFGYRQIRIREGGPSAPDAPAVKAQDNLLENEHLRVSFLDDGSIGLFDKDTGRQVFVMGAGGARAVVIDDPHGSWAHIRDFDREIGAFDRAAIRVMESGSLLGRVRVRTTYGASTLTTDWILYSGSRKLEARITLDWHEQRKMLKLSFPVDVSDPEATWEIPYGHISRAPKGNEEPGHRWIDLTGRHGLKDYGLSVLNDAKFGYSINGNDLRVSIVRSPLYGHRSRHPVQPDSDYDWQNQGRQTLRLLLAPHAGSWRDAGIARAAEELTAPLPIIPQGIHPGSRPQSGSFLAVDASNVVVSVLKRAETHDDLIVRCFETDGRETEATLDFPFLQQSWSGTFRPSEIKTLRIQIQTGAIREVNALED